MKIRWDKEMTSRTLSAIIVVLVGIIAYFIFLRIGDFWSSLGWFFSIFKPFVWGLILAYFINFLVVFTEKQFFRRIKGRKAKRTWSMIASYVIFLVIIVLFLFMLIPQTIESIGILLRNLPGYFDDFSALVNALIEKYGLSDNIGDWINEIYLYAEREVNNFLQSTSASGFIKGTYQVTSAVAGAILNIFIAFVVSIYFLSKKEIYQAQFKKTMTAHLGQERTRGIIDFLYLSNKTFSNFLIGKLLDSLIVGVICFIFLSLFRFPFPLLISVIVGVTNIIPFFGPFIGAIPSFLIILIANPAMALWFLLFILILQQIDGNIIGPKVLGFSIGVSSMWILFAIIIGAKLFGFIGMVVGVPAFAVIYALFKRYTEKKLKSQDLPTETKDYHPKGS